MLTDDETIDLVLQMLRTYLDKGPEVVLRELGDIAQKCVHEKCRSAASVLMNDYAHLRDGGLSQRQAVQIILAPRFGETTFGKREE